VSTFSYTTNADQDQALEDLGSQQDPPQEAMDYLKNRVDEVLASYVRDYRLRHSPVDPTTASEAFLQATPEQQEAAMRALNLTAPTTT
jgi:hypothetical protein